VQSIKNVVLKGVKFFLGHNEDNSTEGRKSLGEVVWDGQKEIDGVLHHVVVGYFPDRDVVEDKDICSQESEWDFVEATGDWLADKLYKLTGIALSSSSRDKPAFAGARRLAMVQALDVDLDGDDEEDAEERGRSKNMPIDLTTLPFDDIAREVARRKTFPSQLFTIEDLKKDREFVKVFDDAETGKKTLVQRDAELKAEKDAKVVSDKALQSSTAKERFVKMVDAMTLTPKQKEYIKNSYPAVVEDASEEGLKKFVAAKVEDYKVVVKTFGVKDELPSQGDKKAGAGVVDTEDQTKAANNPLLEEDLVSA
jgi:hypothetical protein